MHQPAVHVESAAVQVIELLLYGALEAHIPSVERARGGMVSSARYVLISQNSRDSENEAALAPPNGLKGIGDGDNSINPS